MKRLFHLVTIVSIVLSVSSCVQRLEPVRETGLRTLSLTLEGDLQPYDAEAGTKAISALSWKSGDIIYVRTETTSGASTSYAQYNANGGWTFNYTGSLNANSKVQCYFFDKPRGSDSYQVSLSYGTAIYGDNSARLEISEDGESATLTTYLMPKTGRISFHGTGQSIQVTGLSWYSSFDLESFTFTETANAYVKSFLAKADNYFYGFFGEDNASRELFIENEGLYFKRAFGTQVLRAGVSGYVDVPTHDAYDGWTLTNEEELVKYQPIVFEDEVFKNWLLQQGYDRDGDGEISYLEGEKVIEIIIENTNSITSLKGIEFFPNLVKIRVTGLEEWDSNKGAWVPIGKLTAVDVSKNPKLQEINLDLNQLTSLDLSNNPVIRRVSLQRNLLTTLNLGCGDSLEDLNCSYNSLTSMDVSPYPNLLSLRLDYNQLSWLDVTPLAKLQLLYCSGNHLTTLDISGCPELASLNIEGNNDFASIDLYSCPYLSYFSFGYTAITSIDLSICPNLNYVWCWGCKLNSLDVSSLANLNCLYCGDCGLTSLDVTQNPKLSDLDCSYNQLGAVPDLSNCSQLSYLRIDDIGITSLSSLYMANLRTLSCSYNDFSVSGLDLSGFPNLRHLECHNCQLTALDLSNNMRLEYLYCASNYLTDLDIYANSNLVFVDAQNNPYLAQIVIRTGHGFPEGLYYDGTTEIVYMD